MNARLALRDQPPPEAAAPAGAVRFGAPHPRSSIMISRRPLGDGGDGEQRVGVQRDRDDRAVGRRTAPRARPPPAGSNTRPLWSTTPAAASSAMTHPPRGCTVISDRPFVQAHSGSGTGVPRSALVAMARIRLSRAKTGCSATSGHFTWMRSFSRTILPAGVVGAHDQVGQGAVDRPVIRAERDLGEFAQAPGAPTRRTRPRLPKDDAPSIAREVSRRAPRGWRRPR